MIQLAIGLALILIPFLLVILFKDKRDGFFYVFSGLIGFSTIFFILLLWLHIFYYSILFSIYFLIDLIVIFYVHKKVGFNGMRTNLFNVKVDWMLVFILIVLLIEFGSVHFNYTGKITFSDGIREVSNFKSVYPYYSDEWSAIALIKYSIDSNSLPFVNPLFENSPFPNPEFVFHSFLSGLILFFGLGILSSYSYFALFFGVIICILFYSLLRYNNVSKINSGIACLFLPFIVNGANLPGFWYLIPLNLGIVCMLLCCIFISMNNKKLGLTTGFLILLFYPPLFVFYTFIFLCFVYFSDISINTKLRYFLFYFGICFLVAILIFIGLFSIGPFSLSNTISYVFSKIAYSIFTENAIPDYSIWKIIPIPILLLGFFGIFINLKDKTKYWLVAPIVIGFAYWFIYSSVLWRFIIEYQRVVFTTSLLIVCFSGYALEYLYEKSKNFKYFKRYNLFFILQIVILILLFVFSFTYTKNERWNELKLKHIEDNREFSPNPPASNYLIDEDISLFKNINKSRFLSTPWKGLVIGAATGNYPLDSKSSTITVNFLTSSRFMNSNCSDKKKLANEYGINYVYLSKFDCESFEFIGKSSEEFYLYKFINE